MKRLFFFYILIAIFSLQAKSVNDYLKVPPLHQAPSMNCLDAAFVIHLQDHKNLVALQQGFEKYGIPLVEFNHFNTLPMELMSQFCSSIVSPYLLTQTLSHLSIYKYCLENKLPQVLIVEDQAFLTGDPKQLESILEKAKKLSLPWDIIYTDIDYHNSKTGEWIVPRVAEVPRNKKKINKNLSQVFCRYGTAAYIISESGMRKLLNYFQNNWTPLPYDQVLFKIPGLNIYGANSDIITNKYSVGAEKVPEDCKPKKEDFSHKIGEEFWISPVELLSFDRFDIMPKYIYTKYAINNYQTNWHIDMYKSHLEKWVKCYNTKPLKIGFKDFQDSFNDLIQSVALRGFDENFAIGVNEYMVPWNGAHRIGACAAMGIPIKAKAMEKRPSQNLSSSVFRDTYHVEEKYLDHMALEYAKLKDNTYMVCLLPSGYEQHDEAEKILKKHGSIIYFKDIWLTQSGALEFIRLVYTGEWWVGCYSDDFKHSRGKTLLAFPDQLFAKNPVRVYLYECDHRSLTTKAKEEIRQLCKKNNEAIHINDTHEQTKVIAETIFNKNGLDFINKKNLKNCENFDMLFDKLLSLVKERKLNPDHICIGADAVLSAYGLRDCVTLDVLCREDYSLLSQEYGIMTHLRSPQELDEVLFNPENHFYYKGLKFIKLELVKKQKENRGSLEDYSDVKLINSLGVTHASTSSCNFSMA